MSCFTCYGRQYRLRTKEALPLWTLHPRRWEPREQGLRAWPGAPASGHSVGLSCRVKGPCPRPVGCAAPTPWSVIRLTAPLLTPFGRKRRQGRDRKPQPEAQRREWVRIPGEAFTLDASGSHAACRQGEEQGEAAGPAPAASPARTDAGCNQRGCPNVARRYVRP